MLASINSDTSVSQNVNRLLHGQQNSIDSQDSNARPGGQRRNGNKKGNRQTGTLASYPVPHTTPSALNGVGAQGETRPEDDNQEDSTETIAETGDDVDAELCFICASPVVHQSVAPCNHRTCHICALRMRALYKSRACAHCRTEASFVIFTNNATKHFEDFVIDDLINTDSFLGIHYETKDIEDDTTLLLRYNCPDTTCDVACLSWPDLHRHVRNIHHKAMCNLCTRNKKVFTHEHEMYTHNELRHHERKGDTPPGKIDQTGFKGHPECGFCRERFYGDDELFVHCRDKHEKCHLCERQNNGGNIQYFINYDALEQHFRQDHFLCADEECLEKKFVVFGSDMDLKAHQLEVHPGGLSKDARRDARRVNLSTFHYRAPHTEAHGTGHGARAAARGRDPNSEPLPSSSAQPLRRDELAYQRQIAIRSFQPVTSRPFGGQLTSQNTSPLRPSQTHQVQAPGHVLPKNAATGNDTNIQSSTNSGISSSQLNMTPQEQARKIQHDTVMERASVMLERNSSKLANFRKHVSLYRSSTVTASEMIDLFLALFDVTTTELGKLVKELADLYESDTKRIELLKAWNDWRAINEDYPTLPGPSGALPGANTTSAGRRILKLKNSTAQSSRSSAGQQYSGVSAAAPLNTNPVLAGNGGNPGNRNPVSWATSSSNTNIAAMRSRPTGAVSVDGNPKVDAFPALPAAPRPNTTIFGLHRGAVRWDDRNASPANPWAKSIDSNDVAGRVVNADADEIEQSGNTGKKKGKKGKQTLYKFG